VKAGGRRSVGASVRISLAAIFLASGFTALGVWQVHRLAWKRELIAAVDARVHAPPVPAPREATAADAYRRVRATGYFLADKTVLVQASTVRGPGYWVMTPLVTDLGFTLLVNRGFVPPEAKAQYPTPSRRTTITGLLRTTEPRGGFLRANVPTAGRWYSRDVSAIAANERLAGPVALYFVDAEAGSESYPVGGLTVIAFSNNHLGYAVTWFALAAMTAGAYSIIMMQDRKATRS
jgi:surfeit locus 1 family protein